MHGKLCIEAPWLNLDLSMYPSFLSSLYSFSSPGVWTRRLWPGKGSLLYQDGDRLCCSGDWCSHRLLEGVSGAWCIGACRSYRPRYQGLIVSAALEPIDRILVASAVVLSRRTSYATNVRRWMLEIFGDKWSIEDAIERARRLRSPQPRALAMVFDKLVEVLDEADDPWRAREKLLRLPGIGPKTADAILLFTGLTTSVAPADTHLERQSYKLGIVGARRPAKQLCLAGGPVCHKCRYRGVCLSGRIVSAYDGAAGLVQTEAYVADRLGYKGWRRKLYTELKRYYRA
ncbi:MAG: hypothetical protein ABWW69_01800 [Pyrodictiaceae archaeon]